MESCSKHSTDSLPLQHTGVSLELLSYDLMRAHMLSQHGVTELGQISAAVEVPENISEYLQKIFHSGSWRVLPGELDLSALQESEAQ